MSTKAIQKTIDSVISCVNLAIQDSDYSRLYAARQLHWAHNVIDYSLTDYKSWANFCRQEITLSRVTISTYIRTYNLVKKFGYTHKECCEIIAAVGWTRFALGLMQLKRKARGAAFIKASQKIVIHGNTPVGVTPDSGGDRAYAYSLPCAEANKIDGYLCTLGMSISEKGRRKGVREAMIRLINEILD